MVGASSGGGPALLAARLPALAAGLPRLALGDWPTPLTPAPALRAAPGAPDLLLKDDGHAAHAYGGNKVRKLEYLLGDALARGCDTVVTFGAVGSNHALATAVHTRARGLACHAVLTDQPPSPRVADALRWHARLGTVLHPAAGFAGSRAAAAAIRASHPRGPGGVAEITWGGSSPLGVIGFLAAALELADQLAAQDLPAPQAIYLPLGTMGSVAGLAIGLALAGLPTRVVGVQVVPPVVASPTALEALAAATVAWLREVEPERRWPARPLANVELRDGFLGAGYAVPTAAAIEAVRIAGAAGLALETTYSGKALAALLAEAPRYDPAAGPVVFWNTCNARPYPAGLAGTDTRGLPRELQAYLDGAA